MPFRWMFAMSYYWPRLRALHGWVLRSREGTNLTYDLTDKNLDELAHVVSVVGRTSFAQARTYIDEALTDADLHRHVIVSTLASPFHYKADARCCFGRRLGWYAFVRLLKPRVVVETGVDKGHGAVLLCAALTRNSADGHPGVYYGTDINESAGWLLRAPYDSVGKILYGDSIESIERLDAQIDLFINDSDHSADYEYREYRAVASKLAADAVLLGDNAHVTPMLARFSRETGRRFVFFREEPKDHWYPGAGIGISFVDVPRTEAGRQ